MRRDDSRDPDNLLRGEGNDLQSNYDKHDIVEHHLVSEILAPRGYEAVQIGIDMREDDEDLIYDDEVDLEILGPEGETVGYIEVKSKGSRSWMNRCNTRHFEHYLEKDRSTDEPVYIMFGLIDEDEREVTQITWVSPMETEVKSEFTFPDRNAGVWLEPTHDEDAVMASFEQHEREPIEVGDSTYRPWLYPR